MRVARKGPGKASGRKFSIGLRLRLGSSAQVNDCSVADAKKNSKNIFSRGAPIRVLFRRTLDKAAETNYYVSNAEAETPWQTMAMVSGRRWYVEECFEDGKTYLGMADCELRSWAGWHHPMSLVALAHVFVTLSKRDLKKDKPELTLDMAVQLLRSAFARRTLTEQDAIRSPLSSGTFRPRDTVAIY